MVRVFFRITQTASCSERFYGSVCWAAGQTSVRSGIARGTFVFATGAITETLQYFGVPIFGRTFDVLDYLMFGVGIGLAVVFERIVLSKIP